MKYQKGFTVRINNTKFKQWDGKRWQYFVKTRCNVCKKEIIRSKANLSKGYGLCSYDCRSQYHLKENDPKLYNILDNINNLDFYYLIGLIASDGHIVWKDCTKSEKSYYCMISLIKDDKEVLEKIKNKFGGYLKIQKNQCIWQAGSKTFVQYLRDMVGLTNNKSLTLNLSNWFFNLTNERQWMFVKGFFDGDGCISKNTKNGSYNAFICTASKYFADMLKQFFDNQNLNTSNYFCKSNNVYNINFLKENNSFKNILDKFYLNNTKNSLYLNRKYERYKELCLI